MGGRSISLVLADDHRMLRESLRRALVDHGFDVTGEAANGEEAVRLAGELQPDVVLMDVSMPVLDGFEATRAIRKRVPGTSVLFVTGSSSTDDLSQAMAAGAAGYLTKDRIALELADAIRAAAPR